MKLFGNLIDIIFVGALVVITGVSFAFIGPEQEIITGTVTTTVTSTTTTQVNPVVTATVTVTETAVTTVTST